MAQVKPTRQELLKLKNKLKIAEKGHKLLKDKRDGLIKAFLKIVRESLELRKKVDAQIIEAMQLFQLAEARTSSELLQAIAKNSKAQVKLTSTPANVMGVHISKMNATVEGDPFGYGVLDTNHDLDESLVALNALMPDLIRLVELEDAARKLAEEIEKTRRRVNGLQYVIIPDMKKDVRFIQQKLEESARQEKVTLMKVKEQVA
jgi:V/A-type H+/Na+-transporting ATPase subunit D